MGSLQCSRAITRRALGPSQRCRAQFSPQGARVATATVGEFGRPAAHAAGAPDAIKLGQHLVLSNSGKPTSQSPPPTRPLRTFRIVKVLERRAAAPPIYHQYADANRSTDSGG